MSLFQACISDKAKRWKHILRKGKSKKQAQIKMTRNNVSDTLVTKN